jgi:DtxR family Mn-dependent transcriptional regulator
MEGKYDESLEKIWCLLESGNKQIIDFSAFSDTGPDMESIQRLADDGLLRFHEANGSIEFTERGFEHARFLIRAHRIAERLINDVLGNEYESGACEFEHIHSTNIVDSICTLLGHPRQCPHGLPIPEGECCKSSARMVRSSVIPLTELEIGQSAKIAYVQSLDNQQHHLFEGMQIRPGSFIKLHQKYPSYVIECEGTNIAVDDEVAGNIRLWADTREFLNEPEAETTAEQAGRRRKGGGRQRRGRDRKGRRREF